MRQKIQRSCFLMRDFDKQLPNPWGKHSILKSHSTPKTAVCQILPLGPSCLEVLMLLYKSEHLCYYGYEQMFYLEVEMTLILVVIVALILLAGADRDRWPDVPRKRRPPQRVHRVSKRNTPKRWSRCEASWRVPGLSLGSTSRYPPSPARWWWE
jgi:hypothetical protein